jgi:hypothetical protein
MRNPLHYTRLVIAVAAGAALALTSVTAASARPSHAWASGYVRATTHAESVPAGVPEGLQAEQPVIIHVRADTSGVIGYLICLYHSENNCSSDTANGLVDPSSTSTSIGVILATIGDGVTVCTIVKAAANSYKWVKKYLYKGKHIYTGKGDGLCMADFGYDQDVVLASCGDAHGIYWQDNTGQLWDTYAKGDMIASNLDSGTHLFVHKAKDWYTWGFRELCENSC